MIYCIHAALNFDKEEEHKYVSKPKKVVFITGATGTMGQETMKQLLSRNNRFKIRILARSSEKNRQLLKKYMCPSLEVVWGDMADYDTIKKCVDGADYVLHIGAMVSPAADKYPEKTLYTKEWQPIGTTVPDLAGEYFLVTGSGKYFRNVIIKPEDSICMR